MVSNRERPQCFGIEALERETVCATLASGERRFRIGGTPGYLACTTCVVGELVDLRQEVNELNELAFTDELTGIPTRRYLKQRFNKLVDDEIPFGALALDVSNFGLVNNRYGHDAGDEMLVKIARFLVASTRETDSLVARMGGDEFAMLVRHDSREELYEPDGGLIRLARRLDGDFAKRKFIQDYNNESRKKERLGLQIATALWEPGLSFKKLMKRADPKGAK